MYKASGRVVSVAELCLMSHQVLGSLTTRCNASCLSRGRGVGVGVWGVGSQLHSTAPWTYLALHEQPNGEGGKVRVGGHRGLYKVASRDCHALWAEGWRGGLGWAGLQQDAG